MGRIKVVGLLFVITVLCCISSDRLLCYFLCKSMCNVEDEDMLIKAQDESSVFLFPCAEHLLEKESQLKEKVIG